MMSVLPLFWSVPMARPTRCVPPIRQPESWRFPQNSSMLEDVNQRFAGTKSVTVLIAADHLNRAIGWFQLLGTIGGARRSDGPHDLAQNRIRRTIASQARFVLIAQIPAGQTNERILVMMIRQPVLCVLAGLLLALTPGTRADGPPIQPVDVDYSAKIREYTTEPFFLTELVDHLPASATVPSPQEGARVCHRHAREADVHEGYQRLLPHARRRRRRA